MTKGGEGRSAVHFSSLSLLCLKKQKSIQKAVQLRDFVIPEKFGIGVFCGYAVFVSRKPRHSGGVEKSLSDEQYSLMH